MILGVDLTGDRRLERSYGAERWVRNRIHDPIDPLPYYNGVYASEVKKWWKRRAGIADI